MATRQAERGTDDRVLVLAFQDGDRGAYDAIYRRYGPMAERICRRYLLNPHDAEEAAQETMLRVLRSLPQFNGRYALRAWVARIATNVSLDQIRHDGRTTRSEELNGDVPEPKNGNGSPEGDPSEVLERVARREEIRAHLAQLPERHRIALVLREVEGLGHNEIAVILHTTPARVKALLHRARRGFRLSWGNGERHLGVLLPVAAGLGWLRRMMGRVQDLGSPGVASSPTVTTLATTGGDHFSSAVAAVVLAGSIGLVGVDSPPRGPESSPTQDTVYVEPAVSPVTRPDARRDERRGRARAPAEQAPEAVAIENEDAASTAQGPSTAQQAPEKVVLPEPEPAATVRPQPSPPPGFTFTFSSDWVSTEACSCVDSPQVTDLQLVSSGGELASFSSRIQGGAIRGVTGQPGWQVDVTQSGSSTEHTMQFSVQTASGANTYGAKGSQVGRERTAWGGWVYRYSGTYELTEGPEGSTLPKRGTYSASLTFALREGKLVDATLSLADGEY